MHATPIATNAPGHVAGRWLVDTIHSDVSFTVRHLVSKVRGRFQRFDGQIVTGDDLLDSSVMFTVDAGSIDTNNDQRDTHLRSADFLDVSRYPTLSFSSTGLHRRVDGSLVLDGDLTIKDITRPISADLELVDRALGPEGDLRAGYTARFEIDRKDYNVTFHAVLETGGALVGDKVSIELEVAVVLRRA